jgi:hypothetical protein
VLVVTLLAHGCPIQAIVAACGLDERTVTAWLRRTAEQCQQVHEHLIGERQFDLGHVQADEIKASSGRNVLAGPGFNSENAPVAGRRGGNSARLWINCGVVNLT